MGKTKKSPNKQETTKILTCSSQILDLCSRPVPAKTSDLWKEHLEIRKLLSEISALQKATDSAFHESRLTRREENLDLFLNWCKDVGIESDGVTIGKFERFGGGWGLVGTKSFSKNSILVKVPRKAMLSVESAERSSMFKQAIEKDPILKGMTNVTLSLFTLNEKLRGKDSFWYPYISVLPSEYCTALYFDEHELGYLKGSVAFEEGLRIFRSIVRQFAYFHQILGTEQNILSKTMFNIRNFTFDKYRWAVSTTMTRINLIPSANDQEQKVPALIPFLDFANHSAGPPNTDFDEDTSCAVCRAAIEIKEGDQIFIFYGARNNADFLLHDGFVYTDDLSHDYLSLKLGLSKTDRFLKEKKELLHQYMGLKPTETFCLAGEITKEMVQFAELFLASETEISAIKTQESLQALEGIQGLEEKALMFLRTRFEVLLRGYGNVSESAEKTARINLAETLIQLEKNNLSRAIQSVEEKLKSLS